MESRDGFVSGLQAIVESAMFAVLLVIGIPARAEPPGGRVQDQSASSIESERQTRIREALQRGFQIIRTGAKNYPEHRQCFSCHHQALPLLALSLEGNEAWRRDPKRFHKAETTQSILEFTETSFGHKREALRGGANVGGRALTVAYGLWAMDLAGARRNETTDAMVESLLKTQAGDGAWDFQSLRPPAASSRAMTTAIALYGLQAYGPEAVDQQRLVSAYTKAIDWAEKIDHPSDHEDLVGLIWLDYLSHNRFRDWLLGPDWNLQGRDQSPRERGWSLRQRLHATQREDGGWAQTNDLESDAYATGQALLVQVQTEYYKHYPFERAAFRKAIDYLLNSQNADGSWHVRTRSKPVQVYFDNGDPHGKDQFVSMMATSWAVAALASYQSRHDNPLESHQVLKRNVEVIQKP